MKLPRYLGRRLAAVAGALAVMAGIMLAGPTTPAQAYTFTYVKNSVTKKCLDHSNSNGLRAITCNGGNYQKWYTPNGSSYLKNVATGKCLDHSNSYGLRAITCNGGNYQRWTWAVYSSENGYAFKNYATQKCLDHSTAYGLRAITCTTSVHQDWWLNW